MQLTKILIDNYRNFNNAEINFNNHSLLFGTNDVGKTNLLRAIRLILDKSLSQVQYEADDSDYCIYSDKDYISIFLEFTVQDEVEDEYVYSKFGKHIKEGKFYVAYHTSKELFNIATFYIGYSNDLSQMVEIPRSYITTTINCIYLDSTRDLQSYLRKAKQRLISDYKLNRSRDEIENDDKRIENINIDIKNLNTNVEKVSYIEKPTETLTEDLKLMSIYNDSLAVKLTAINEFDDMIKNTSIITEIKGKNVEISGDGRKNQLYISMWTRENNQQIDGRKSFQIFIIEEPESHLHFPMQATTLSHILGKISNQMIISSHSPKVILEFNPNSLVRIYKKDNHTYIANNGCSKELEDKILDFGYRNSLISGEMFFSDGVFLVEGPSEEIFYKELCHQLEIDLNYFNIRIIPVNGIGFKPYVYLLNQLNIPFSVRTDNDIFEKDKITYHAGINRLISINNIIGKPNIEKIKYETKSIPKTLDNDLEKIKIILEKQGLFLATNDLENDISEELENIRFFETYKKYSKDELVTYLKDKKAINMFKFMNLGISISDLESSTLIDPLVYLLNKVNVKSQDEHDGSK